MKKFHCRRKKGERKESKWGSHCNFGLNEIEKNKAVGLLTYESQLINKVRCGDFRFV